MTINIKHFNKDNVFKLKVTCKLKVSYTVTSLVVAVIKQVNIKALSKIMNLTCF